MTLKQVKSVVDSSPPQSLTVKKSTPIMIDGINNKRLKGAANERLRKIYSVPPLFKPRGNGQIKKHNCLYSETAKKNKTGVKSGYSNPESTVKSANNLIKKSTSAATLKSRQENENTSLAIAYKNSCGDVELGPDSLKSYLNNKRQLNFEEQQYLIFLIRITEDIIVNDFYSNDDIRQVFRRHIEANKSQLNLEKMHFHISKLCQDLSIDIEEYSKDNTKGNVIPKYSSATTSSLNDKVFLNCSECLTLRTQPLNTLHVAQQLIEDDNKCEGKCIHFSESGNMDSRDVWGMVEQHVDVLDFDSFMQKLYGNSSTDIQPTQKSSDNLIIQKFDNENQQTANEIAEQSINNKSKEYTENENCDSMIQNDEGNTEKHLPNCNDTLDSIQLESNCVLTSNYAPVTENYHNKINRTRPSVELPENADCEVDDKLVVKNLLKELIDNNVMSTNLRDDLQPDQPDCKIIPAEIDSNINANKENNDPSSLPLVQKISTNINDYVLVGSPVFIHKSLLETDLINFNTHHHNYPNKQIDRAVQFDDDPLNFNDLISLDEKDDNGGHFLDWKRLLSSNDYDLAPQKDDKYQNLLLTIEHTVPENLLLNSDYQLNNNFVTSTSDVVTNIAVKKVNAPIYEYSKNLICLDEISQNSSSLN